MSEDTIIKHCAPTLAGLKTGNIFTAAYESEEQLEEDLRRLNGILNEKGLRVLRLRARAGRALIYVYRPGMLKEDLSSAEAEAILTECGYREPAGEGCLARLISRIRMCADFPHEIGLFLGYPPEDVRGFFENSGKDCKACGCWKVYGDADAAKKQFERFEKCTAVYLKCLQRGIPLGKLAVRCG